MKRKRKTVRVLTDTQHSRACRYARVTLFNDLRHAQRHLERAVQRQDKLLTLLARAKGFYE